MFRAAAEGALTPPTAGPQQTIREDTIADSLLVAHRHGDQAQPYTLIAKRQSERDLRPSLCCWMAVRAVLSDWSGKPSNAAVTDIMIAEKQVFFDVAAARVCYLRDQRRNIAASAAALMEHEEPSPRRMSVLLAALTVDIDICLGRTEPGSAAFLRLGPCGSCC